MDEPKSLDSLFKEKIFRIPDYQRGYAWQGGQLKDFWEDLINLSNERFHYTGVVTLKETPKIDIAKSDKEYWLVEDHSYKMYEIVDGQQRLTTFIVFLQAFLDYVRALPAFAGKTDDAIYITESLSVEEVQTKYLFKLKPTGDHFRTYKFGYAADNPSYEYLRYCILHEKGAGSVQETFYTLNLSNAVRYFTGQLSEFHDRYGMPGLQDIYKTLTKRFLFNEYVIKDDFDVFVAFETMNNRGKKLSDLELLKNRLIYLTTLYDDDELDDAARRSLRETVNGAWKEVYHQLGRNRKRPLNDDDFLRAHWIMYFKYSRKTGKDYIKFLLEDQFTPQRARKLVQQDVQLEVSEEQQAEFDFEESESENLDIEDADANPASVLDTEGLPAALKDLSEAKRKQWIDRLLTLSGVKPPLKPTEIRDFVNSLKESSIHWFRSFFPDLAGISDVEQQWIDRLNRIGMGYFRPLVMSILKKEKERGPANPRLQTDRAFHLHRVPHEWGSGQLQKQRVLQCRKRV